MTQMTVETNPAVTPMYVAAILAYAAKLAGVAPEAVTKEQLQAARRDIRMTRLAGDLRGKPLP